MNNTDQTVAQTQKTFEPAKIWRPVRPTAPIDPTADQINQLLGKINAVEKTVSNLSTTVQDVSAANPTSPSSAPDQVTAVSATVTAKNINGVLMDVITVSFTPGFNFAQAQLWITGYNGNSAPQLLTQGFSSPIEYAAQVTGELVTLTVVAVNSAGVAASFSSAPTATALLNNSSTAPPAPTINQGLVALSGGTGWQFAFNLISGLLSDVVAGYWVYRSSTHTTPTGTSQRFQWIAQPPSTLPYTFQDVTGGTFYYWVSAVSVSGLESSLTDATAVSTTIYKYPSTTSGSFSNPAYAYDGNDITCASSSVSGPSGHGGSSADNETWSGFTAAPGAVTIDSIQLQVSSSASVLDDGAAELAYSLDGGSTWTDLYYLNTTTVHGNASESKQYFNATLSTSQDLTLVQVKANTAAATYLPAGGDPSDPADWVQGSTVQNVYEARIAVTYH